MDVGLSTSLGKYCIGTVFAYIRMTVRVAGSVFRSEGAARERPVRYCRIPARFSIS